MLNAVWQWFYGWKRKPAAIPEEDSCDRGPLDALVTIHHRVGAEVYVFRYRHRYYQDALREVGLRAAEPGSFSWHDAAIVTREMRAERLLWEWFHDVT